MNLLADIAQGNTGFSDIMFLVAFILFVIAFVLSVIPAGDARLIAILHFAGLACVALGWLVL